MRWNLQVRASAAAAPPSAARPAPSQASAAAGRVLRAGSELGLRPAAAAGPGRCSRDLRGRPVQAPAAGPAERAPRRSGEPAGAENGGGPEELNGAGTPGGGPEPRRTAPGARGGLRAGRRGLQPCSAGSAVA